MPQAAELQDQSIAQQDDSRTGTGGGGWTLRRARGWRAAATTDSSTALRTPYLRTIDGYMDEGSVPKRATGGSGRRRVPDRPGRAIRAASPKEGRYSGGCMKVKIKAGAGGWRAIAGPAAGERRRPADGGRRRRRAARPGGIKTNPPPRCRGGGDCHPNPRPRAHAQPSRALARDGRAGAGRGQDAARTRPEPAGTRPGQRWPAGRAIGQATARWRRRTTCRGRRQRSRVRGRTGPR